MGLISTEQTTVRGGNLLDTLCARLEKKLSYQPGERDLVMLQHKFVVEWQDGKIVESSPAIWPPMTDVFRKRSRQPSSSTGTLKDTLGWRNPLE